MRIAAYSMTSMAKMKKRLVRILWKIGSHFTIIYPLKYFILIDLLPFCVLINQVHRFQKHEVGLNHLYFYKSSFLFSRNQEKK
jgi:hypothetical protein